WKFGSAIKPLTSPLGGLTFSAFAIMSGVLPSGNTWMLPCSSWTLISAIQIYLLGFSFLLCDALIAFAIACLFEQAMYLFPSFFKFHCSPSQHRLLLSLAHISEPSGAG